MSSVVAEDHPVYLRWAARMKKERAQGRPDTTDAQLHEASRRHRERAPREELFGFNYTAFGVSEEFYRMGRRPVSPALETAALKLGVRFEHLAVTIGTVIHGVDLRAPSAEVISLIHKTQLERKVVFFRNQSIDLDQQCALGRSFGPLDAFPFGDHCPGRPEVLRISGIGTSAANLWHSDVTWMERPSLGSILHMVEAPTVGGDTSFSDSHAAYLGLPAEIRKKIENVRAIHDYSGFLKNDRRIGICEETIEEIKREIPFGVSHPLVRTHPETGKQALYLHGGFMRHGSLHTVRSDGEKILWDKQESRDMVRFLLTQHAKPEYQCRFKWEKGSIAFWDNRACQHCATGDYYPNVRIGHRVTISGSKPYYDPNAAAVTVPLLPDASKPREASSLARL